MSYNLNRDYDASLGRYVESDPLGLIAGPNIYSYAGQNPTYNTDRTGLMCTVNYCDPDGTNLLETPIGGPYSRHDKVTGQNYWSQNYDAYTSAGIPIYITMSKTMDNGDFNPQKGFVPSFNCFGKVLLGRADWIQSGAGALLVLQDEGYQHTDYQGPPGSVSVWNGPDKLPVHMGITTPNGGVFDKQGTLPEGPSTPLSTDWSGTPEFYAPTCTCGN